MKQANEKPPNANIVFDGWCVTANDAHSDQSISGRHKPLPASNVKTELREPNELRRGVFDQLEYRVQVLDSEKVYFDDAAMLTLENADQAHSTINFIRERAHEAWDKFEDLADDDLRLRTFYDGERDRGWRICVCQCCSRYFLGWLHHCVAHCSEQCRSAGKNQKQAAKRRGARQATLSSRRCEQCNELFKPTRTDARYCSGRCRTAAKRARDKK